MQNPNPTHALHIIDAETSLPWQGCDKAQLADKLHEAARRLATSLPAGEHRLRDNLIRSSSQLLKQLAVARMEPDEKRHTEALRSSLRALTDTSVWVLQCVKLELGPQGVAAEASDLIRNIYRRLQGLGLAALVPFRDTLAAKPGEEATVEPPAVEQECPVPETQRSSSSPPRLTVARKRRRPRVKSPFKPNDGALRGAGHKRARGSSYGYAPTIQEAEATRSDRSPRSAAPSWC